VESIRWVDSLDEAKSQAAGDGTLVLIDFFNQL